MILLAVDPGIRGCGIAVFETKLLSECAYVKNDFKNGNGPEECAGMAYAIGEQVLVWMQHFKVTHLALEWPRVYQRGGGKTKGDPNDLLALCGVDGALAVLYEGAEARAIQPAEWKGQMKKDATHARIESRLSKAERAIYDDGVKGAKSLGHNVADAVGIGLFALDRFNRVRVFARQ